MLAALDYRDFRLFWAGLVVSNIGTWMQQFGLGWLVVQLAIQDGVPTLAPFYLGLTGLARALPGLAFGLFGGVVADRADRRRLLLVTQTSAAISAAVLGVLTISGRINIVEIVLISALNSIIFSFDAPTRQAMVPRLVSDRELMSAIGLNSAAFNGATLVGPLIGGVLIIPFGVGGLMVLNAVSYFAVVAALLVMRAQPVDTGRRAPMLDSIREGLSYLRHDPVLRWVVELSWLLAASGAGALGGALITASLGGWKHRGALLVAAAFAHGSLLMLFGTQRSVLGALVFVGLTSFAVMVFLGMGNTLMQTRTPDALRGRVMSVNTMVFIGFMPLGQLVLGAVGTVAGINTAFLIGGIIVTAVALYAGLRVTALREAVATPRPRAVAS